MNIQIQQLYQNLYEQIVQSGLPAGVIYLIIKDLYREVEIAYKDSLSQEQVLASQSLEEENLTNGQDKENTN